MTVILIKSYFNLESPYKDFNKQKKIKYKKLI